MSFVPVVTWGQWADVTAIRPGIWGNTFASTCILWRAVDALHKPYICALNGTATGAGLDMALMADMRYAARSARFAETYIKVGLVPRRRWCFSPATPGWSDESLRVTLGGDLSALRKPSASVCSPRSLTMRSLWTRHMPAERLANGPSIAIRLTKQSVYQCLRRGFPDGPGVDHRSHGRGGQY